IDAVFSICFSASGSTVAGGRNRTALSLSLNMMRSADYDNGRSARMGHPFTIGVEEEFQIVDPSTWELRSHVSELLASSAATFGDNIKRELHQSIVEVGTKICSGVDELCEEIIRSRRGLADAAERV